VASLHLDIKLSGKTKTKSFFSEMKLTIVPTANKTIVPTANNSSSLLLFKLLTSHFRVVFDKTNYTFNNLSRNQFIVGFQASTWFIRWSKRVCWSGTDSGGNWKGVVSGWSLHYHSLRRNTLACFFFSNTDKSSVSFHWEEIELTQT